MMSLTYNCASMAWIMLVAPMRFPPLPSRNFIVSIADPGGAGRKRKRGAVSPFCAPLLWVEQNSTTLIMRAAFPTSPNPRERLGPG
jgi:hypothetical protein